MKVGDVVAYCMAKPQGLFKTRALSHQIYLTNGHTQYYTRGLADGAGHPSNSVSGWRGTVVRLSSGRWNAQRKGFPTLFESPSLILDLED